MQRLGYNMKEYDLYPLSYGANTQNTLLKLLKQTRCGGTKTQTSRLNANEGAKSSRDRIRKG